MKVFFVYCDMQKKDYNFSLTLFCFLISYNRKKSITIIKEDFVWVVLVIYYGSFAEEQ